MVLLNNHFLDVRRSINDCLQHINTNRNFIQVTDRFCMQTRLTAGSNLFLNKLTIQLEEMHTYRAGMCGSVGYIQ